MRQRLVALAAAATLAATAAAPAFADTSTGSVPTTSVFRCTVNASLSENGKQVYSVTRTFTSRANLARNFTRTYAFGAITYSVTASVTCTR